MGRLSLSWVPPVLLACRRSDLRFHIITSVLYLTDGRMGVCVRVVRASGGAFLWRRPRPPPPKVSSMIATTTTRAEPLSVAPAGGVLEGDQHLANPCVGRIVTKATQPSAMR